MNDDQQKVLKAYPHAFVWRNHSKKEIRRPREINDPPALVRYVLMSGVHWTDDDAWKDAAKRISV